MLKHCVDARFSKSSGSFGNIYRLSDSCCIKIYCFLSARPFALEKFGNRIGAVMLLIEVVRMAKSGDAVFNLVACHTVVKVHVIIEHFLNHILYGLVNVPDGSGRERIAKIGVVAHFNGQVYRGSVVLNVYLGVVVGVGALQIAAEQIIEPVILRKNNRGAVAVGNVLLYNRFARQLYINSHAPNIAIIIAIARGSKF